MKSLKTPKPEPPSKNVFIVLMLLAVTVSCSKNKTPPIREKHVNATVALLSGSPIIIDATGGRKAYIGCTGIGYIGGFFVDGFSDDESKAVIINVGNSCVTSTGTYAFNCQYVIDYYGPVTKIYANDSATNKGSITFTKLQDDNVEGFFNAVCRNGEDSVSVNGTFNGKID